MISIFLLGGGGPNMNETSLRFRYTVEQILSPSCGCPLSFWPQVIPPGPNCKLVWGVKSCPSFEVGELCSVDHIINVLWLTLEQSVCLIVPKMTLLWDVTVLSWVFSINNTVFMMTVLVLTASPWALSNMPQALWTLNAFCDFFFSAWPTGQCGESSLCSSDSQIKDWILRVSFLCGFKADLWK